MKQLCMDSTIEPKLWVNIIEETETHYIMELTKELKLSMYIGSDNFNGNVGIPKAVVPNELLREVE